MKEVSESWWLNKGEKGWHVNCSHQMYLIQLQYCLV